ncbi:MAG TPA: TlpA disulfide reductase family protein [Pyrinomonadaceae bacterium]|nr:TlpA disulfide reductase family protein [Pyrinomonadaceae bacterium]
MRIIATILLATCALASLISAQATSSSQNTQQNAQAVSAQASVTVHEVDLIGLKKLLSREGEHAHPLAVNFWGTFCDPCREEMPDLVRINSEYKARGLEFILVSVDDPSDIKKKVPQFLQQVGAVEMPAYLVNASDPETIINAVDRTWNGGLPATFLYDAQGHLVFKHTGRVNPAELRQAINKLMSAE